jgi:signal transduction histidine kinase
MHRPKFSFQTFWPLPLSLLALGIVVYAQAIPMWAQAVTAFAVGALATWHVARVMLRGRMAELAIARQRLEQDVAEIRRLEQSRKELYAELLHSQKLEALGTLAGGVAHDLNNALVPVLSLSKLVLAKLEPDSREHLSVEMILAAGRRARDLVRQVLAFSRKTAADRKPVALDTLVDDVLRALRPSFPPGIAIEQRFSTVPPVAADRGQLEQVLSVLLSNAAQAITDGVGIITIELAGDDRQLTAGPPSTGQGPSVRFTLRDTGCGMDAETKRRIFEPFFTTKEVGRGTGLGLAVVHGIVAAHGGQIAVESEPGVGTRFDIFLPCIAAKADSDSLSAAAA